MEGTDQTSVCAEIMLEYFACSQILSGLADFPLIVMQQFISKTAPEYYNLES